MLRGQARQLAHRRALEHIDRWALSSGLDWLAWSGWLGSDPGELELLKALCHRRWGEMDRWRTAMETARSLRVPEVNVDCEVALGIIRSGEDQPWIDSAPQELLESGVRPDDVASAFLDRYVTRGEYAEARQFLEAWARRFPDRPHNAFLQASYWLQLQMYDQALEQLQLAIAAEPQHELARKMLAELLEMQGRLGEALPLHLAAVEQAPDSKLARLGLARALRKLNRVTEARQVLDPLLPEFEDDEQLRRELGQLELESGNYSTAKQWLMGEQTVPDLDAEELLPTAIASHLLGDSPTALQIVDRYESIAADRVRGYDLQLRLALDPRDQQALNELRQLQSGGSAAVKAEQVGSALYREHCGACHGDDGDGNGRASRHLFPAPRSFRHERFRFVSTTNGTPSLEDIEAVIAAGLPGTSMPAFPQLPAADRLQLAEEVLRIHRDGLKQRYQDVARADGDELSDGEASTLVDERFDQAAPVEVPSLPPATPEAIARGAKLFRKLACHSCHGTDGVDGQKPQLFDESGRATWPRDFAHEPLKSGSKLESTYLRIRLGMPGTPHPASPNLPHEDLVDLVHYCHSLSQTPHSKLTNFQRRSRANRQSAADDSEP